MMNIESKNRAVDISEKIRGNWNPANKSKIEFEFYALYEARKMLKNNEISRNEFDLVLQEVCRW